MLKSEARTAYLEKRARITLKQQAIWDDLLLIQVQQLPLPPLHAVFSYAAIERRKEISTDAILSYLEFRNPGMQVAYPVYDAPTSLMKAVWVDDNTLFGVNEFGISEPLEGPVAEPAELDLVFVPLLCFDERGYRVGYGKGVYDRYLKEVRQEALLVGLSYFEPVPQIADTDKFDVPLNYCITPQRIYEF
ncbi:5-formyltetrahydrofolate cyclo-ligase [Niabella drilacis]|uniref:5-formyltetrahydrofolate cyclo-ligase n=1 Tax=Niabella drilacis (strain DSM 25811 / CCM 8410 / CCUG 62505 / LMG 26954 / E90) TaxID=1285928 RepID=A0A1G6YE97_NIADE|nr:5-formyltetrahydrofolate cyclo-ligase [Niabella drilacis]SDD88047.1 5-formyltetrahydrofolate cyclo-ligase [Niabella drilacis]